MIAGVFRLRAVFPVFCRVREMIGDVTPTTTCPNAAVEVSVAPVCVPNPESATTSGVLAEFETIEN